MSEPKGHPPPRLIIGVIVASVLMVAWLVCRPNFVRSGTTKTNGIIHNLRMLSGAKGQWASEHNRTGVIEVPREGIAVYLTGRLDGWVRPLAGEQYLLRTLTESPEAVLTREVDGRPKGTRIRLLSEGTNYSVGPLNKTNWGCEIILPDQGAVPNAAPAHR